MALIDTSNSYELVFTSSSAGRASTFLVVEGAVGFFGLLLVGIPLAWTVGAAGVIWDTYFSSGGGSVARSCAEAGSKAHLLEQGEEH